LPGLCMTLDYRPVFAGGGAAVHCADTTGDRPLPFRMQIISGPPARIAHRLRLLVLAASALLLPACAQPGGGARGPYPAFTEYEDRQVKRLEFVGELRLPTDSLGEVIVTRATRCRLFFLPICLPLWRDEYRLDLDELSRDVVRLQLYYRDHGFYGTRIVPSVDPVGDEQVTVRLAIAPGDRVVLTDLEVQGVEEVFDSTAVAALIPLRVGEPFRRIGFLRSADTIRTALLSRGYAYADVLRNYSLDTIADVAQAQFIAIPGPLVTVDTILFAGIDRLTARTLRKQITLREGELLRRPRLAESQRNLYDLQMVNFASLEIADDSLQLDSDPTTATVLARIVEAPEYLVDAAVGIGTVDCLRSEARWLDRNFLGGGRSLEVGGLVSKIGVGSPLDWGLERSACRGATAQPVGAPAEVVGFLNYRAVADFEQPRLLNTRTELGVTAHVERLTELNAYLRESAGAQLALSRDIGRNKLLNVSVAAERGRTLANPVIFCVAFEICSDFSDLERFRWSNVIAATAIWDRTQTNVGQTRGFVTRASVDWASPLLRSDNRYVRLFGEAAVFQPVKPGWVLASNLRLGSFLQGRLGIDADGYIPPERRFYAGGPNSVRGFRRNALGPTAYVTTVQGGESDTTSSAIGGTQMVVASVEMRMPSPVLSDYFRVAAFVDAGQVWAQGFEIYEFGDLKVTPGLGLRISTPVGPMRLDVAYNGYEPPEGPLYEVDSSTGELTPLEEAHVPFDRRTNFWKRLEFSFAVGQAF
jgi:outer membrane protein insertion porin family